MAEFTVTERPKDTSSGETDGKVASRDSVRKFQIFVAGNNVGLDANYVRAYAPLPAIGSPHPRDAGLFCRNVSVEKISQVYFEADANYLSPQGGSNPDDSPTLQPAVLRWSHAAVDEEIDQDADGKPIITVTGESFDPPIRRQFGDLQLTFERSVFYFDPLMATEYIFTTNSDSFLGFPPGTVLCTQFSADSVTDNPDLTYWRRIIAFLFRFGAPNTIDAKAWYRRMRAEGYKIFDVVRGISPDPSTPVPVRALDGEGLPVITPVLHDTETGKLISDPQQAQWYEFKIYQSKPFQLLLSI